MQYNAFNRLRGKSALDAAHVGINGDDEPRLESAISVLYDVDSEEASEIHANYHIDRIFASLVQRAEKNGMRRDAIAPKFAHFDFQSLGQQVAKGKLAEAAAVDLLFRQLSVAESAGKSEDRYVRFYG